MTEDLKVVFGKNLERYRQLKNISMVELANEIGVSQSTISDWENGKKMPRSGSIQKLADYFHIQKTDLLMDNEALSTNNFKVNEFVDVPILGTITCGEPILTVENFDGYRRVPKDNLPNGEVFYLKTKGDSMAPTIRENSYVLIKKQPVVEDGEIAAVIVNGDDEMTLKRVKHQNGLVILTADNSAFAPIIITPDTPARIIGKALQVSFDL